MKKYLVDISKMSGTMADAFLLIDSIGLCSASTAEICIGLDFIGGKGNLERTLSALMCKGYITGVYCDKSKQMLWSMTKLGKALIESFERKESCTSIDIIVEIINSYKNNEITELEACLEVFKMLNDAKIVLKENNNV